MSDQACATPLYELLESVPAQATLGLPLLDENMREYGWQHIPYGHHCRQAAAVLRKLDGMRHQIELGEEYACMDTEDEDPAAVMALFRQWIARTCDMYRTALEHTGGDHD